ncbi:MAG: CYTH domain-containing protein [Zoogloeaceae bacterium]|jgi:triphosphatase|nr:CYTH domain-containing protein [Zoogloeaceae bacterium]
MACEIEIKMSLPVRRAPCLRRLPWIAALPCRRRWLRNLYLDTPDFRLMAEGVAARLRQTEDARVLTVKRGTEAEGQSAVSRRQEWEALMASERLDFSCVEDAALRGFLEEQESRLKPVFSMDFARQSWYLETESGRVELALDLGFLRAGLKKRALHEIELELVEGEESALFFFARRLWKALPDLRPEKMSKAARGYMLAREEGNGGQEADISIINAVE